MSDVKNRELGTATSSLGGGSRLWHALSFLIGAATFVATNTVLYLMAYPTFPNPGDQSDVRLPLFGLVALVVVITFLGRAGAAFGAGFATGFVMELLFLSACTTHWADPGGTALADARTARRVEAAGVEAEAQAKAKWISQVRKRGLDLAAGVHRLRLVTGCVLAYRQKQGDYPPPKDSLPDMGEHCYELRRAQSDESGWRILYSPRSGAPRDSLGGFRITVGPDPELQMRGPLLEVDQRGLMLQRDNAHAPAFAVGSPLYTITAVVTECMRKSATASSVARRGALTLRDLLFYPSLCGRVQLEQVKTSSGTVVDDPNVAYLHLPTTGPAVGIPLDDISTSWTLTYLPRGRTPADGYQLHVRPLSYGFTGVRSYLVTAGEIYVTSENRRATLADPLPEACERDPAAACDFNP